MLGDEFELDQIDAEPSYLSKLPSSNTSEPYGATRSSYQTMVKIEIFI